MIKGAWFRGPTPEQRNRIALFGKALLTAVFSAAQMWSASVLLEVVEAGVVLFAFVLVLSAAFIAVLDGWLGVWRFAAASRSSEDCGG
ncbi:hypothetical protein SAMN02982929_04884 [Saccharopolyspora kobensis]|uniref:Uncharacterized protein n=1 Tax=Saccharopolyspora kobensis TaxID=146035 RepID=A0A1H6DRT2_9PSEU|nr:hypothetical protein [Saccharopolyspora kobensis]SEG87989.1 hypothetical protein SAMN02982929_04884 [Saccharopolyspora kobensis]SFE03830.1 hypothetical protein SAMN05216506_108144 [Saccharopolyspora kobensis]